jgi:hypothetical protein
MGAAQTPKRRLINVLAEATAGAGRAVIFLVVALAGVVLAVLLIRTMG